MQTFYQSVFQAELGKTHLFSVGQAGFIIKSPNGILLGVDLYLSDYSQRDEGHIGFKRMLPKILGKKDLVFDYLICTHPHSDHFDYDSVQELMDNDKTKMFASVECKPLADSLGLQNGNISYVKPGDNARAGDFILHFINCDHGTGAPDAFGIIVEVDGKRFLEVGDSCLRLDRVDEYLSFGPLDVMIAPINGAYGNLNEEDCARLSSHLNPKLTIPCHYGMFASHFGLPGKFMDWMKVLCPNNDYLIMTQGEGVTL